MRFLVDAQLPRRVKHWLILNGVEAIHTLDLPNKNRTPDSEILREYAVDDVIVISKDKDFPHRRIINGAPKYLLWITTGNISNNDLIELFEANFEYIKECFASGSKFLELNNESVIVRE